MVYDKPFLLISINLEVSNNMHHFSIHQNMDQIIFLF